MKRFISLALAILLLLIPLSATASAVELSEKDSPDVQPRLTKTVTLTLSDAWTDVVPDNNWFDADVLVKNHSTSAYSADVRIVSEDHASIIKESKTIASGYSHTFYNVPSGGYVIQARSSDGVTREYTFTCSD